jgi:hypothetical protein
MGQPTGRRRREEYHSRSMRTSCRIRFAPLLLLPCAHPTQPTARPPARPSRRPKPARPEARIVQANRRAQSAHAIKRTHRKRSGAHTAHAHAPHSPTRQPGVYVRRAACHTLRRHLHGAAHRSHLPRCLPGGCESRRPQPSLSRNAHARTRATCGPSRDSRRVWVGLLSAAAACHTLRRAIVATG